MNDINAVKPPIETPVLNQSLIHSLWIFFGVLLVILALFLIYYLRKKHLAKLSELTREEKSEEPIIDYQKIAKEKLKEAKRHIDAGEYKIFHLKSSEIIKEYLGKVYSEDYLNMTTREISKRAELPDKTRSNIKAFLKSSDLVKFADKKEEKEAAGQALGLAFLIIE